MPGSFTIEPTGSHDSGICNCCGQASRCVWGHVYAGEHPVAAYYVHWTLGHIADVGANIDLIVGKWGEDAPPRHRFAIALAYRLLDTGPAMMVIDGESRPIAKDNSLISRALRRDEVIGTKLADDVFAIADAILDHDQRVAELLGV